MKQNILLGILVVLLFSFVSLSESFALVDAAKIKNIKEKVANLDQVLVQKEEGFAKKANDLLTSILNSLRNLFEADLAIRLDECIRLAEVAQTSLLQQDYDDALKNIRNFPLRLNLLNNPTYEITIKDTRMIYTGFLHVDEKASWLVQALKYANQDILTVREISKSSGGIPTNMLIRHVAKYPITGPIKEMIKIESFNPGLCWPDTCFHSLQKRILSLKNEGNIILNLVPKVFDKTGDLLRSDIYYMSERVYWEELKKQY
ncbi:MAG: hypothetical protein HQM10_08945 [Candidatus Riflebacteria bacterium]|nr:hypothetical protein [Candidatus Riflebacteria bacterium]